MKIEIIDNWNSLDLLARDWNGLLQNSNNDTVFQTWEWISAWRNTVADTFKPLVFCCKGEDDCLLGVAAFYICEYKFARVIPLKILRSFGEPHSGLDYPGLLFHKDHENASVLLLKAIAEHTSRWDAIWIPTSPAWGGYNEQLINSAKGISSLQLHHRPCTFTHRELPSTLEELPLSLSKSKRNILKRHGKKILKNHEVKLHCHTEGEELDAHLQALFKLHELRWRSAGEPGAFIRRPKLKEFYETFVPVAREKGWLRLHVLELNGKACAAQIGYRYNDIYYSVQEGFDPDAAAGCGNYLRFAVMEACVEEGIKEYDFLAGPSEHKRSWGGVERLGIDLLIYNNNLKSLPARLAKCWPGGRALKESPYIR